MCVTGTCHSRLSPVLWTVITLWLGAGLSSPICWVFNPKTCVFQFGKYIELLLKNDVFPFSLCFLFGVLEFSFGHWSSRTYPPIDITFFGFHSILQNENLSSTISFSSSICFHCSYTFLFPGDLLLLLLSEFLVTSYLWVRNVIFSPNSEYFVDFFKFQCHTYLMFTPNMFICLSFVSYLSFFFNVFQVRGFMQIRTSWLPY